MRKVALVNDTSLYSPHFGCQLVGQVFREQFKRVGLELIISLPKEFDLSRWHHRLADADIVVVNGEGSIHHGRNAHLVRLAEQFPVALMNCVFEDNRDEDALKRVLFATARESLSANEITKAGIQCEVVPDVIFASSFLRSFPMHSPSRGLCVTDNVVQSYRRVGPFRLRDKANIEALRLTPAEYVGRLSSYERVCAGRFHAAVVCAVLGIPFSTWDSNTWKTRGMLQDMGVPHLHFGDRSSALANVPREFDDRIRLYAIEAPARIEAAFDQLCRLVRG